MADLGDFTAAVREHAREQGELDTFTFHGERFALAPEIGTLPLMKFAAAADSGLDSDELAGLSAMYDLIRSCLVSEAVRDGEGNVLAEGWPRFERVCIDQRVSTEDLFGLVTRLVQAMTGRPTRQPSDSPVSPSSTSPMSRSDAVPAREAWDARMRAAGMLPVDEAAAALAASSG